MRSSIRTQKVHKRDFHPGGDSWSERCGRLHLLHARIRNAGNDDADVVKNRVGIVRDLKRDLVR